MVSAWHHLAVLPDQNQIPLVVHMDLEVVALQRVSPHVSVDLELLVGLRSEP